MDSDNKNRKVLAIVIFTIIFGALSIFAVTNLFKNNGSSNSTTEEEVIPKKNYIEILENETGITLSNENDFVDFKTVGLELVVMPVNYDNYTKPCFDFMIEEDGVVITNRLAKEFDDYGFVRGDKIVKINDVELKGKTYFEILDLIYAKNYGEVRKFTLADGREVNYVFVNTSTKIEYDAMNRVLHIYNLDEITVKAIHDYVLADPNLTLDLSQATVNTYDGIVNFLSLFSEKNEVLFVTPENIVGQRNRKIDSLNIVVGGNQDEGILFTLTAVKNLNENITIDRADLNTTSFKVVKKLISEEYIIYIKDYLLKTSARETLGGGTLA